MSDIVEISGQKYRIGNMGARKQLHVSRRLGPAMLGLLASSQTKNFNITAMLGPAVDALSKMSDEDTDYVIDHCLDVVQREQDNGQWARIRAGNGGLMFQDIGLLQMLNLTRAVLAENLKDFFPTAAQG